MFKRLLEVTGLPRPRIQAWNLNLALPGWWIYFGGGYRLLCSRRLSSFLFGLQRDWRAGTRVHTTRI